MWYIIKKNYLFDDFSLIKMVSKLNEKKIEWWYSMVSEIENIFFSEYFQWVSLDLSIYYAIYWITMQIDKILEKETFICKNHFC